MRSAVVVPSLGNPGLGDCLGALARLQPPPADVMVVLSGPAAAETQLPPGIRSVRSRDRLGFAAAVNTGLAALPHGLDAVALVNDDAEPEPAWLGRLETALAASDGLAAVQGTVTTADRTRVDGRGIAFDRFGLPVQVDHRARLAPEAAGHRPVVAVSLTAALLRRQAVVEAALPGGRLLDESFDSYHEDTDLGLRWHRLGWRAAWVGDALCRHRGSSTGAKLLWRHPGWVLANRWRALGGNLTPAAMRRLRPRLLRGELRAVVRLARRNPLALLVAPWVATRIRRLVAEGAARPTPGPRLDELPSVDPPADDRDR